jgi:cell pole-organizing protein PopZ
MPRTAPVAMPPPPLPTAEPVRNASDQAPPISADQTGTIEDATADLLRPMLRQWLADNMPRMVEKALHIEIAESLKVPKKL